MRRSRSIAITVAFIIIMVGFTGCQAQREIQYEKHSNSFFDTFNTVISLVAYTENDQEFEAHFDLLQDRFRRLHMLYDIYNDYEGINNVKTINDNAGIAPVKVDQEIIDLILFSKDWYERTGGGMNIALGPVLKIWHDYREEGRDDPLDAKLPPMDLLENANQYTDIHKVLVDIENSTVYLPGKEMSLDVGAVAKGYAAELVAKDLLAAGLKSGILNAGGNIRVLGKPMDGVRERWGIGIQDPEKFILSDEDNLLDVVFLNDASVVSSGDYERYYVVEDKIYHHIIDPKTLMPGEYYRAITVVGEDSAIADLLSTAAFVVPMEESKKMLDAHQYQAIWVMHDGSVKVTEGMKQMLRSLGASGSKSADTSNDN